MPDHTYFEGLIWQIADLLRGPYRPPEYHRVILAMTVLRRFDCVLAGTKAKVCPVPRIFPRTRPRPGDHRRRQWTSAWKVPSSRASR